jgi:AraC family transcriptional activator of pobA
VARLAPAPPPGREDAPARRIAARFLDLLEAHYAESRSVAFYADRLGRTPAHLNRVCKQALGQTASAQIRARVMAEARRELAHTARPVAEIAWRLGFDDPGYFARVFREMHGESPRAWRARAPRL